MTELNIRKAIKSDFDKVWEIFSKTIKIGDTYVFNPETPKIDIKKSIGLLTIWKLM